MQTVWEALQGVGKGNRAGRRTGAPIRRHSRLVGREAHFWRPFAREDVGRYMAAAERFERSTREKGRRVGALGSVGLEVLRELLRLIDYKTGRLDPAITTLQERLRRSRDAIVRALANLRAAGFLDWIRRYKPTGHAEGVQVQQASNAYRLSLPPAAAKLLGKWGRPAPIPLDEEARRADHAAEAVAMIERLPLWERPFHQVDDPELAAILSRLARSICDNDRESAKQEESGMKDI